jgi:hypothetical protein
MISLKKLYKYYDNKFQRTFVLKLVRIQIHDVEFVQKNDFCIAVKGITWKPMDNLRDQ